MGKFPRFLTMLLVVLTVVWPSHPGGSARALQTIGERLIGFDCPEGLKNLRGAARDTFVFDPYKEDGAVFVINVVPPDPALRPRLTNHYHLGYEVTELNSPLNYQKLSNPENEPRLLGTMLPGHVVQMTYDPNNDGIPDPFTLKRVRVLHGRLNVGIKSNKFGIGVYNNLTAGTWGLLQGDNITRATFETPLDVPNFSIDDIVFEPFKPTPAPPAPCPRPPLSASNEVQEGDGSQPSKATPPFIDPLTLLAFIGMDSLPPPRIDILPGEATNAINPLSEGEVSVAIITTEDFDATSVDPLSVEFGPVGAGARQSQIMDVDGDGDQDLLLDFVIQETGVQCGDISLSLKGQTFDGQTIIGFDFISTNCENEAGVG